MGDMKYFDFDVAIEPAGDGFTARVFNSPVGQAAATFSAPFSDLEIENFLLRVGRSRHAVRRIESPELASAKQFGGRLFDQVFTGEVRGCLRSSLDEAGRQGAGLRVRLHLTKVPALADLPWEFLYNASMNRFLSLSVETPLVRYLELPERIRPLIVQPPLRVLMMISSPSDYPQLDVKRETAKITEALSELEQRGLVTVELQENATLAELQRRLRKGQYHIFHFVGHGGFDAQAEDGLLIMEDQENRGRRVSAQFLGTLLHDHRPLRLAVLNACEGARASRGDPFAGTAQSLVQQGIPAVIAMQFEVTDEAAICFTREFYAAIAVGYPVDAALAEARKSIFAEVSEVEWGTPVLYMRSPDGKVFEVEHISEPARKQLHISSLLTAARTATASGDHPTAVEKLEQLLALEPENTDAATLMAEVTREERELAELYAAARGPYDAGHWREALDRLRRVQAIDPAYRDTPTLIELAEKELGRAAGEEERKAAARAAAIAFELKAVADEQSRRQAAAERDSSRGEPAPGQSSARRPVGWLVMGGALGAVAMIALLVLGGVAMVMFMAGQQNPTRPSIDSKSQSSDQSSMNSPAPAPPGSPPPAPSVDRKTTPAPQPSPVRENPAQRPQRSPAGDVKTAPAPRDVPPLVVVPPSSAQTPSSPFQTVQQMSNDAAPGLVRTPSEPASIAFDGDIRKVSPPADVKSAPALQEARAVVTPVLRQILEDTIRSADAAEIQAYRTFNPVPLARFYGRDLLANHIANLQENARNQVFFVNRLHQQRFEAFSVSPDGTRAQVRLTEFWSKDIHSVATGRCVSHIHERPVPQTLSLELTNEGWRIHSAEFHTNDSPQLVQCH